MKELLILQQLNSVGMLCNGYKNEGESYQDWEFMPSPDCNMLEAFRILRAHDFFEIRLDIPKGDVVTATRLLY